MDEIECQVEAKLQNWRPVADPGSLSPPKRIGKKRRRKRSADPVASATPTLPPPNVDVTAKVAESLSETLLKPREEWAEAPRIAELPIGKKRVRGNKEGPEEKESLSAAAFVEQHRFEVGKLGARALEKRERKAYEAAMLLRLGCRPPRNQKMPIGLLIEQRSKEKARALEDREKKREEGVLISSKRKKRR